MRETFVSVYDNGNGIGVMSFQQNADLPGLHERHSNELSGLFTIVVDEMAKSRFWGKANVQVENGAHAGNVFSITITQPQIKF